MDSLTHIVLGATLGEAMAGSRLKKKAMILGAVAQSLPDIDVVAGLWTDPAADLLAHRGFTHSILFAFLIAAALAWFGKHSTRENGFSFRGWVLFFLSQILIHDFLDSFNAYGTGWFEPFSHARISFNVLFVADPLYTSWLIISTLALLTHWQDKPWRVRWTRFGLTMSSLYLILAMASKFIVDRDVEKQFSQQSITHTRSFTTPTPFNSMLWYIVAEDESGYSVGYRSVLHGSSPVAFHHFTRNDSLLNPIRGSQPVKDLLRFSQNYYVVSRAENTLVFSDLRFGQMGGWDNPGADFVFHFYLEKPDQNKMVLQRGRFSNWNRKTLSSFWGRMIGE